MTTFCLFACNTTTQKGGGAYQLYGSFPSLSNEAKLTNVSAPRSLKWNTHETGSESGKQEVSYDSSAVSRLIIRFYTSKS